MMTDMEVYVQMNDLTQSYINAVAKVTHCELFGPGFCSHFTQVPASSEQLLKIDFVTTQLLSRFPTA